MRDPFEDAIRRGIAAIPCHDRLTGALVRRAVDALHRRRPRRPGPDAAGVPVAPRRPSTLDGGAAAALEFDS